MKDRIDKGKMKVEYCPIHLMLVDLFAKPLMGKIFRKLRSVIMGYTSIPELYILRFYSKLRSVLEYKSKSIE